MITVCQFQPVPATTLVSRVASAGAGAVRVVTASPHLFTHYTLHCTGAQLRRAPLPTLATLKKVLLSLAKALEAARCFCRPRRRRALVGAAAIQCPMCVTIATRSRQVHNQAAPLQLKQHRRHPVAKTRIKRVVVAGQPSTRHRHQPSGGGMPGGIPGSMPGGRPGGMPGGMPGGRPAPPRLARARLRRRRIRAISPGSTAWFGLRLGGAPPAA